MVASANAHDSQVLGDLLHGNERRVYGDSTYTGQQSQIKTNADRQEALPISVVIQSWIKSTKLAVTNRKYGES